MNIKIKNPLPTIKFVGVSMCLFGIWSLLGIFAPLIIMVCNNLNLWESFVLYVEGMCNAFDISSAPLVIYGFFVSLVMSCIYIISGIFIIFRKSWARRFIVYSLLIFIPLFVINSIVVFLVRGCYSPNSWGMRLRAILYLIFNIWLLYLFTRVQIKQLFIEQTAEQRINNNT